MHITEYKIMSVDFDGVCVEEDLTNWCCDPDKFVPIRDAIPTLLDLQKAGWKIILFTCRNHKNNTLQCALDYLKNNGFTPDAVNDNIPGSIDYVTSGKPYAKVYLDDRSFPPFTNWADVRKNFL